MARLLQCMVALALAGGMTSASRALTVAELQRTLQSAPVQTVSFHEVRESPWLERPAESRGTLHSSPGVLEKRVDTPRRETWRLLPDRMEWTDAEGKRNKQIMFNAVPAAALLSDALRHVVAGDLHALENAFRIELREGEHSWSARLEPLDPEAGRYLDHLELEGTGARLQVIVVVERHGERTTTRLYP